MIAYYLTSCILQVNKESKWKAGSDQCVGGMCWLDSQRWRVLMTGRKEGLCFALYSCFKHLHVLFPITATWWFQTFFICAPTWGRFPCLTHILMLHDEATEVPVKESWAEKKVRQKSVWIGPCCFAGFDMVFAFWHYIKEMIWKHLQLRHSLENQRRTDNIQGDLTSKDWTAYWGLNTSNWRGCRRVSMIKFETSERIWMWQHENRKAFVDAHWNKHNESFQYLKWPIANLLFLMLNLPGVTFGGSNFTSLQGSRF